MSRRRALLILGPVALLGLGAAPYVPWEDLTEADALYALATRFSSVGGHRVHYPTPTAELLAALEQSADRAAPRHLAEARREMGDLPGALAALEKWAEAEGPEAWAEAARWAAAQGQMQFAMSAAGRAIPGLAPDEKRSLADDRVRWADAHPEAADPLALRQERARLFPKDSRALEDWIRALEKAGRLKEADEALAKAEGLAPHRRLLLRSDLLADHDDARRAFEVLDAALDGSDTWSPDLRQAYAGRADAGNAAGPPSWRSTLEGTFDPRALVRLATYFQGQGRGDAAADLLRQVERRYETGLARPGFMLVSRLHGEIDAVPEAFRALLAAAQKGTAEEQTNDLAGLARLALRAGGRPLAWGVYDDEPYRWAARLDRTPGFWTGGVSFLLTGQDWKEALARLESESLPERTFATARALLDELARRSPSHPELPALRVAVMARHVERGDGRAALALLPLVESGPAEAANEGRRVALLALRQTEAPIGEEIRLYRARLAVLAPDGSEPEVALVPTAFINDAPGTGMAWKRTPPAPTGDRYADVLDDAIAHLDRRDRSHRAAVDLILEEMDRLPRAEGLWEHLANRLDVWNLDDDLGPRYERALERFRGPGFWARAARWYAARQRSRDLDRLASELVARFRTAGIFARSAPAEAVRLPIPDQPKVGTRVRLVLWADWVRLKAVQRFPQSPEAFRQARGRLLRRSDWEKDRASLDRGPIQRLVVDDAFLDERGWALLFADPERREAFLAEAMRDGSLERRLAEWEASATRTPVEEQLLFEGWSRLSRFERAAAPAGRLAAAYPGDGALARRVLSLYRSLAGLDAAQAAPAAALVARTAPALSDPSPLWTELGELEEERGRPEAAKAAWGRLLERDPRNPERVSELATVLWDYGHMKEALDVIEEGRKRLSRPHLLAFEAGVLREERNDIDGAIGEYLGQGTPDGEDCFCSAFERDQRALRRLAQLLSRERARKLVEGRIASLRPGVRADEQALLALLPLSTIQMPDANFDWTADDWIEGLDHPADPLGRAGRAADRERWRPEARLGMERAGRALLAKTLGMLPKATDSAFLDAVDPWGQALVVHDREQEVTLRSALLARRAELAPNEESRIAQEVARARYLFEKGRSAEADAVWASLAGRIGALPEGTARLHAEADRAAYLERARGVAAAAAEWAKLAERYPWSLGVLEDRLAFLGRSGRGADGRTLLEGVIPRAAPGRREPLLERLTREALEAQDLQQARRAVEQLLGEPGITEGQRLGAVHLLARLSIRQEPSFDPLPLATAQAPKLDRERQPDLYMQLARAADAEQAWKTGMTLWIEALNRRLERSWLRDACRTAKAAGQQDALRGFFEKQQARSPRDVRWAVAVREVRLQFGDLPGAIEAARAAIAVRPERESLWREAADLLIRADRPREAVDLLEGWARPRPADEDAARLRSELLARMGAGDKALAVEGAALEAFAQLAPLDETRQNELRARRGRAARRLLDYGFPRQAFALVAPGGDLARVAESGLGPWGEAELALASGSFVRLLRHRAAEEDFRTTAARLLAERGRPEHREEVQAFVLGQVFPPPGTGRTGGDAALAVWWPFVQEAGMEAPVRAAIARRKLAATPGPWSPAAPAAFVEAVGEAVVAQGDHAKGPAFVLPPVNLDALWVRDLVRRDDASGLSSFLEARWQALVAQVRADTPLGRDPRRLDWAAWLDDKDALTTWAHGIAVSAARVAEVASVLSERRRWDRLWALAARHWDMAPLVALLPEDARLTWFRQWQQPSPLDPDPVRRARGEALERASVAVGRLVAGQPGAAADPVIARLRGPRTVGDVLGTDARWIWPEFTPRRDPAGVSVETGDDAVIGQRADALRAPGALWGERPGTAWFVLETLARLRENDAEAALVPSESPERGREATRALLAVRLAEATGRDSLALDLAEGLADPAGLAKRLALLARTPRKEQAAALFQNEVRRQQPRLDEAGYRALRRIAEDAGLQSPAEAMDPATPLLGGLLAFLYDREGLATGRGFQPRDVVDLRSALAARWREREAALGAEEIRLWLSELWANGAAALPERGLRKLGGIWAHAAAWLGRLRPGDRADGLEALASLPDRSKLDALLARDPEPTSEILRLLRLRVHMLRGETDAGLRLLEEHVAELRSNGAMTYAAVAPTAAASDEEGLLETAEEAEPGEQDALASTLLAWLAPFREMKKAELAEGRVRDALAARRESGTLGAAGWGLAFELAPSAEARSALAGELEQAWRRGDWRPENLGPLVDALARSEPAEASRWLGRWAWSSAFEGVSRRAGVLARVNDGAGAARVLAEGRARSAWTVAEEVKAFDLWRRLPSGSAPSPPAAWIAARTFWSKKAGDVGDDLAAHLRAHPYDALAARAALRSAAAGDPEAMRLAAQVLQQPAFESLGEGERDQAFLRLRTARGALPASSRWASNALGPVDPADLARDLRRRRIASAEIQGALADVARIAARSGQRTEPAVAALEDAKRDEAAKLRAELREMEKPASPPAPYRLDAGRPVPYRPRDLDWPVVAAALAAGGVR
jgi:hypothetical protein